MKKVTMLLAVLFIGSLMYTGCKKDDPTPEPEPQPTPTTYTVSYKVLNVGLQDTMSACFKLDVTYIDAEGKTVTLKDQALPWIKSFEVESPFHAEMSGEFTYKEEELPDTVYFGIYDGIIIRNAYYLDGGVNGGIRAYRKETFLKTFNAAYGGDPEELKFTAKKDLNRD